MFRELDLFPSSGEGETPTLLGPLETVGVSFLNSGRKQIQFPKRYVF
jgi:hypothetical protein